MLVLCNDKSGRRTSERRGARRWDSGTAGTTGTTGTTGTAGTTGIGADEDARADAGATVAWNMK